MYVPLHDYSICIVVYTIVLCLLLSSLYPSADGARCSSTIVIVIMKILMLVMIIILTINMLLMLSVSLMLIVRKITIHDIHM